MSLGSSFIRSKNLSYNEKKLYFRRFKITEFWKMALMVVWTFVGIMFLGSGVLSLWWMFKCFNWRNCLEEIDIEIKE